MVITRPVTVTSYSGCSAGVRSPSASLLAIVARSSRKPTVTAATCPSTVSVQTSPAAGNPPSSTLAAPLVAETAASTVPRVLGVIVSSA